MKHICNKKIWFFLLIGMVLMMPLNTLAASCNSLNNSQSACENNSNCSWTWINEENGDGYCRSVSETECKLLPDAVTDYIIDALRMLRWGALVLMIILSVLDFIKAAAADDQDAIKKAGQKFIKRIAAVIILFILPMLVEFILYVAGLAGFGECVPIDNL